MPTLSPAAIEALRSAEIGDRTVVLVGQLDRNVYVEVNKALERSGGKWSRKDKAHVFASDPREALAPVLGTGAMPRDVDKDAAFFRTPPEVADRLLTALRPTVEATEGRLMALEPSAGDGALANLMRWAWGGRLYVHCVEPEPARAAVLSANEHHVFPMTFEDFVANDWLAGDPFDVIVMNPPFEFPVA